jgi:4-hydroxy-4-methyl-2-oxoglutarate aldolase
MPPSADFPSRGGAHRDAEIAKALVGFGVSTIHEALGRRGLARGIDLLVGPAFAGPAVTVSIPAGDNLGIHAVFRDASPGTVVCVASAGQGAFGVLGDLLMTAAHQRGIAGLVIDDGIRDLSELKAPPSIVARGVAARGTQKRRVLSIHESVALAGVLVRPGDWIVGDKDGTCVVPADRLDSLLAAAAARVKKEDGIRTELQRGRTTADVLGLAGLLEKGDKVS